MTTKFTSEQSECCINLQKLLESSTKRSADALTVIDLLEQPQSQTNRNILYDALNKRVQDTGEVLKEIDRYLEPSSLDQLLCEVPSTTATEEMSWRNLIGRRDVIAHNILNIDNERIYREAKRDFAALHELLLCTQFYPFKADIKRGNGFQFSVYGKVIKSLRRANPGGSFQIGNSIILIYEDRQIGFAAFRLAIGPDNSVLVATSHPIENMPLRIFHIKDSDKFVSGA